MIPLALQFIAGQNGAPQDNAMAHRLWASRGAELLDRIGPAIIQVHSAGWPVRLSRRERTAAAREGHRQLRRHRQSVRRQHAVGA
jgi:hypothetical protein